jgi:hypothetical protein
VVCPCYRYWHVTCNKIKRWPAECDKTKHKTKAKLLPTRAKKFIIILLGSALDGAFFSDPSDKQPNIRTEREREREREKTQMNLPRALKYNVYESASTTKIQVR